jgi:hypothetical protein
MGTSTSTCGAASCGSTTSYSEQGPPPLASVPRQNADPACALAAADAAVAAATYLLQRALERRAAAASKGVASVAAARRPAAAADLEEFTLGHGWGY